MTEIRLAVDTSHLTEPLNSLGKSATDTTSCGVHLCGMNSEMRNKESVFHSNKTMKILYTTVVDSDVDYPDKQFANEVAIYLADPDGWVSESYSFVRSRTPSVVIHLSSPTYLSKNQCHDPSLSCAEMGGRHMYLNSKRWVEGASASKLPLDQYRQYMVSHEMGHILGHDHVQCPSPGAPAPIMLQQTKGIGHCVPNTKLTDKDRKKK